MRKSAAEIASAMMQGVPAAQPPTPAPPTDQKSSFVEFPVPSSFQPPQGVTPNQDFKAVGTFRLKDDGNMCLVAVDGSAVKPSKEEQSEPY